MTTKIKKIGRPFLPKKERRDSSVEVRLNDDERKRLDAICAEAEMQISKLIRLRVLNLSESEIEALRQRAMVHTIDGTILVQGLRKQRSE